MTSDPAARIDHDGWATQLRDIASRPLELCPDFPERAERWEAWWRFEADRPLVWVIATHHPQVSGDKYFQLLDQPDAWIAARREQVEQVHWLDAAIPALRVDLGPVSPAAFVGAPLHMSPQEQTTWHDPIIDDLTQPPPLRIDADNVWFQRCVTLAERLAQDAAGRYLVTLPDLSGAIDALANLRGPQSLLMDLYDHPEAVLDAADQLVDAWQVAYVRLHEAILGRGAGPIQWLGAWSHVPYTLPTCDFNFSIGVEQFEQFCMPSLAEQARRAGRCLFHLDGPGAAKHADTLAACPDITAIQFTPGAGSPSALEQLDMLQRIQAAGKPLIICPPLDELPELARQLDPRGVVYLCGCAADLDEAQRVVEAVSIHA